MTNIKRGYYYQDKSNKLFGPFNSYKDCKRFNYKYIWSLVDILEENKKINKIVVDLDKNTIAIEGEKDASIKILDKDIGNGVHSFEPNKWEYVLSVSKDACKNVTIIGKPIIEGECLDEVLYM